MRFSVKTDPRSRIWRQPEEARFDELLAVLLSSGLRGRSVLQIGQELADLAGSERGLLRLSPEAIASIEGIGRARASVIMAAVELARRQNSCELPLTRRLSAQELAGRIRMRLYGLEREYFYLFSFNRRFGLIQEHLIARGGMTSVQVSFREMLKTLLNDRASSALIAHNHPEGSACPGRADLENAKQLTELCAAVDINLIDQYIVGIDGIFSCRKMRFIETEKGIKKELMNHSPPEEWGDLPCIPAAMKKSGELKGSIREGSQERDRSEEILSEGILSEEIEETLQELLEEEEIPEEYEAEDT